MDTVLVGKEYLDMVILSSVLPYRGIVKRFNSKKYFISTDFFGDNRHINDTNNPMVEINLGSVNMAIRDDIVSLTQSRAVSSSESETAFRVELKFSIDDNNNITYELFNIHPNGISSSNSMSSELSVVSMLNAPLYRFDTSDSTTSYMSYTLDPNGLPSLMCSLPSGVLFDTIANGGVCVDFGWIEELESKYAAKVISSISKLIPEVYNDQSNSRIYTDNTLTIVSPCHLIVSDPILYHVNLNLIKFISEKVSIHATIGGDIFDCKLNINSVYTEVPNPFDYNNKTGTFSDYINNNTKQKSYTLTLTMTKVVY